MGASNAFTACKLLVAVKPPTFHPMPTALYLYWPADSAGSSKPAFTTSTALHVTAPPPPSTVVTCELTTARIAPLPASATNTVPVLSAKDTPVGPLKPAALPAPSVLPAAADPASEETAPAGETSRSALLAASPTRRDDVVGLSATPNGALNLAADGGPSAHPGSPLPASVLTFQ